MGLLSSLLICLKIPKVLIHAWIGEAGILSIPKPKKSVTSIINKGHQWNGTMHLIYGVGLGVNHARGYKLVPCFDVMYNLRSLVSSKQQSNA